MNPISEIFLATDFSQYSQKAEQKAKIMSKKLHVPLSIVNVIDTNVMAPGLYYEVEEKHPEWLDAVLKGIRKKSQELMKKLYKDLEATGTKYILEGNPKEALVSFIAEKDIQILVMGKRNRQNNDIGSVSKYVTQHTDCSVLLVS